MGARGIGEHTMIPTPAAIANALYDACGIRIPEMPITAEKVLAGLKRQGRGVRGPRVGPAARGPGTTSTHPKMRRAGRSERGRDGTKWSRGVSVSRGVLRRQLATLAVPARTAAILAGLPPGPGHLDAACAGAGVVLGRLVNALVR